MCHYVSQLHDLTQAMESQLQSHGKKFRLGQLRHVAKRVKLPPAASCDSFHPTPVALAGFDYGLVV